MRSLAVKIIAAAQLLAVAARPPGPWPEWQQQHLADAFAEREYFYVGGNYVNASVAGTPEAQYMEGQMYVEKLTPRVVKHDHPLVFIHGLAQTATNWLNTPDNRPGWASYFLEQGYIVYLSDQPQRGRSLWLPGSGELAVLPSTALASLFTAPETLVPPPYPQAKLHTQWPGTGLPGDPIFDTFYASQVQYQNDPIIFTVQNRDAYAALLDWIGKPAILITHSQAGSFGWQIGDTRPNLVAAIVALEPGTNPFETWTGPPFVPGYLTPFPKQPYGVTILPVSHDPPLPHDDPKALERQYVPPPTTDKTPCIIQAEPARRLVNLADIPVLQIVGEASFHATYSYCVAKYLQQAGVKVNFVNLGDIGIHGNGHFAFLEKNNIEVAEKVVLPWLKKLE